MLEMGEPVKIIDLARNMIRIAGLEPEVDVGIEIVGRRPGEKLHEELFNPGERPQPTPAEKIVSAVRSPLDAGLGRERLRPHRGTRLRGRRRGARGRRRGAVRGARAGRFGQLGAAAPGDRSTVRSLPEIVQEIGAYAGLASVVGLAVLSVLYFSQARDVKRLREWAGRAPERAEQGTAVVQPTPGNGAVPAAGAAAGAGAATAGEGARRAGGRRRRRGSDPAEAGRHAQAARRYAGSRRGRGGGDRKPTAATAQSGAAPTALRGRAAAGPAADRAGLSAAVRRPGRPGGCRSRQAHPSAAGRRPGRAGAGRGARQGRRLRRSRALRSAGRRRSCRVRRARVARRPRRAPRTGAAGRPAGAAADGRSSRRKRESWHQRIFGSTPQPDPRDRRRAAARRGRRAGAHAASRGMTAAHRPGPGAEEPQGGEDNDGGNGEDQGEDQGEDASSRTTARRSTPPR